MRAAIILLVIIGAVFMALLLMGGDGGGDSMRAQRIKDGEEEPPSWTTWFDAPFGAFAPRAGRFVSGGATVRVMPGEDAQRRLPADAGEESRIATFRLADGPRARIIYSCEPGAKGPCRNPEAVTLCLGQPGAPRHDDCQTGRMRLEGSFEVGSGGGRITIVADGDQPVTVVLRD